MLCYIDVLKKAFFTIHTSFYLQQKKKREGFHCATYQVVNRQLFFMQTHENIESKYAPSTIQIH